MTTGHKKKKKKKKSGAGEVTHCILHKRIIIITTSNSIFPVQEEKLRTEMKNTKMDENN